jgi:hypothetical protein
MAELSALRKYVTQNLLTVGQESMSRDLLVSSAVLSGAGATCAIRLTFFTARKSFTSTAVRMYTGATPAGATPSLARMGVWSVDGASCTLRGSTAHDATLFSVGSGTYQRNWETPVNFEEGRRYCGGACVITAATAPSLGGWAGGYSTEHGMDAMTAGIISGQSDLPASFLLSSVSNGVQRPYMAMV